MTDYLRHPAPQSIIDLAAGKRAAKTFYGRQKARGSITFSANIAAADTVEINGVTYTAKAAQAAATGSIVFTDNFVADDTVIINGVTFTAKDSGASGAEFNIGGTLSLSLDALVTVLNASANGSVNVATYAKSGTTILAITYDTVGTAGNAFTLGGSVGTPSGATLSGGVAAATTYQFDVSGTLSGSLDNLVTKLNASVHADVSVATYAKSGTTILTITHDTAGAAGNAFTLDASVGVVSDDTLTLGSGDDTIEAADVAENGVLALITLDPTAAFALPDGAEGQEILVYLKTRGNSGDAVVTPTNLAGGTTITFNAAGEYSKLCFLAGEWHELQGTGVLA